LGLGQAVRHTFSNRRGAGGHLIGREQRRLGVSE
jgi:hypothetical protein